MKNLCQKFFIASLFTITIFCSGDFSPLSADQRHKNENINIWFRWAFGALSGGASDRKLVSISHDTCLKTGDQFKMMVQLKKMCFVYLIYHGSQNELQLLFPNNAEQFSEKNLAMTPYYIPPGEQWFALDKNIGIEKFYLIASSKRLSELETLLKEYGSTVSDKKQDITDKIISEIKKLRRKHRKFQAAAERPVSIGGTVRAITEDPVTPNPSLDSIAVDISAVDFYSRTFTIEHQ